MSQSMRIPWQVDSGGFKIGEDNLKWDTHMRKLGRSKMLHMAGEAWISTAPRPNANENGNL
jgi:hypothetical protein